MRKPTPTGTSRATVHDDFGLSADFVFKIKQVAGNIRNP